jgi:O-methyltransferase/methyltransferase family protein
MTNETAAPPHAPVLALTMGSTLARALFAVTELGVPDLLADGPLTVDELTAKVGTHSDGLHRVLRALSGAGYFHSEGDTYALTDLGRTLTSGHPTCARELLLTGLGPLFTGSLQRLPETLRTGRTGAELAFDMPVFDYFAQHAEEGARFNRALLGLNAGEPAAVAEAWDLDDVEHVVDVGGGIGVLLRTILGRLPHAQGTLFDRPEVVAQADLDGVGGRVATEGGDFFTAVPRGGDVYLLSHIVHDWDDDSARRILGNIHDAMATGGRVVVVEMVLPSDGSDHPSTLLDLTMLAVTGGRERTEEQYRALLASAGFRLVRVVPTGSPVSLIEAVPVNAG